MSCGLAFLPGGSIVGQGVLVFALAGRVSVSRLLTFAIGLRLSLDVINVSFGAATLGLVWKKGLTALRRQMRIRTPAAPELAPSTD